MRLSLVPKEREYFRLFSEMAANVEKAGELLVALMNDFGDAKSITRQILEHEHVGDKIVHDIVKRLNTTFVTPLDREDIYDLASTMDEILDNIEATADSMIIYKVSEVQPRAREMAVVIAQGDLSAAQGRGRAREEAEEPARLLDRGQPPRERRRPPVP